MGQITRWFSGVIAVVILVGGAMVSQASAAPCNLAVVIEGLACDANAASLFYSPIPTNEDVRITAQANAAFFDSFLVLYHPSNTAIGAELGGLPLLFNHGAPLGPITITPSALGFLAGDELIFALYVDTDPDGTFADGVIADAEYRVFMGPLTRNTPNGIQNHLQSGTPLPPFDIAFLVGFEDRLTSDPFRDSDFNDHIFLFEGALRQQIPNPGALWLLGIGLIGLAIGGRYRTRR